MATITTLTTGPYANISTTASFTGCGQCTYVQIVNPAIGRWNDAATNNISGLRTTQLLIDQNYNTTSTSVECNTSALSQYRTSAEAGNTLYPYAEPLYGLDDECNLLVTWGALDVAPSLGGRSGLGTYGVTATMTGSTGEALFLGPYLYVYGGVSTTDSTGSPSCLANTHLDFTTPIGHYTDPYSRTYTSILPENSQQHEIAGTFLLLTAPSKYAQGFDAVFEQCTLVNPGGSPIALTPAKEIILPAITIPASQPAASPTTTVASLPTIATRLPSTSDVPAIPASTTPPRGDSASTTTQNEERPEGTQSRSTSRLDPDDRDDDKPSDPQSPIVLPTQPSDPPSQPPPDENPPAQSTSQAPADQPSSSGARPFGTCTSALGPPSSPSPEDAAQEPSSSLQRPPLIVPVEPPTDQSQVTTATLQVIGLLPVNSAAASKAVDAPSRVASVRDIGSVSSVGDASDAYAIGSAVTLQAGGPAATISGTVYSALPSGSGVVAAHEPADSFASYIAAGLSGQNLGAASDGSDGDTYVIGNGVTLTAGQEAATLSGTIFSALPTGGEVIAVADGQSMTLTTFPGAIPSSTVPIVAVEGGQGEFAVANSVTISPGGKAATLSGTTYSALPSGSGVVVAAYGQATTLASAALNRNPPSQISDAYVIGGSSTISAGGSALTLSGTTFSALPSGSGVVAVVDGKTTTLAQKTIGQPATFLTNTYIIAGSATISAGGLATAISGTTYSAFPSGAGVEVIAEGESSTVKSAGNAETTSSGGIGDSHVESFTGSAPMLKV